MAVSVFDLFTIGIGPSSSHTVGPMRAALDFGVRLRDQELLSRVARVQIELFGSLALTGPAHGTDRALLLGLEGDCPESVDIETVAPRVEAIREHASLNLAGAHPISWEDPRDLIFRRNKRLPYHSNGMRFTAFDAGGDALDVRVFYSVGGGFVVNEEAAGADVIVEDSTALPYRFHSGDELLERCAQIKGSISDVMLANELAWQTDEVIRTRLLQLWEALDACVRRGCSTRGALPGGFGVRRRAADWCDNLRANTTDDPLSALDWVSVWAVAVNEENAAGGRVVTAPTNGAAGIIPAVLKYYLRFMPGADDDGIVRFLLTAGAIGVLYKENASISGAEVGCQGEVGSACSMAAAGLAEVMGGTPAQVENAAEIGMEHNLGLTCDPVGGLVQVPCIERNAMGAVKAINAARMALRDDGKHFVSLDKVIKTMRDTGRDMKTKYKETARGGLVVNVLEVPVNVIEC
jgi:L-serine dehydratase